jgi:hypothetical protein
MNTDELSQEILGLESSLNELLLAFECRVGFLVDNIALQHVFTNDCLSQVNTKVSIRKPSGRAYIRTKAAGGG